MSLRTRIALLFILIVAGIVASFGSYIYVHAAHLREVEFYARLSERADLAGQFVLGSENLPPNEQAALRNRFFASLTEENLAIFNKQLKLIYATGGAVAAVQDAQLQLAMQQDSVRYMRGERQYVLKEFKDEKEDVVVMATAIDQYGYDQMNGLRTSLVIGGLLAMLVSGGVAWGYAYWSFAPIRNMIGRAQEITDPAERIVTTNAHRRDELGQLAQAFNDLLGRLHASFEMQRAFVANASHELRTPLTILKNELADAGALATDAKLKDALAQAGKTADQLQELISQLIWMAQANQTSRLAQAMPCRLDELVFDAIARAKRRYPEAQIEFGYGPLPDAAEPLVLASPILLMAAVYNLVSNGIKFSPPRHPVRVTLGLIDGWWTVTVTDSGRGIAKADAAHVFELFYRGAQTQGIEGSGIGLSLVRRVAELHGGSISLASEPALNSGTVASLRLPAVA